ncbi:MAG: amidase family protein [Microthrixaceae bacterium]|nr:amidase family protein [Microthrixaceae bacterium]
MSRRLRRVRSLIAEFNRDLDVLLSPTVATVAPPLGHLGADVAYEPLLERIAAWMPYTPLANAGGTPSITVPMGFDDETHLPVGAMLSGNFGADALLVQLALELEEARPWDLAVLC